MPSRRRRGGPKTVAVKAAAAVDSSVPTVDAKEDPTKKNTTSSTCLREAATRLPTASGDFKQRAFDRCYTQVRDELRRTGAPYDSPTLKERTWKHVQQEVAAEMARQGAAGKAPTTNAQVHKQPKATCGAKALGHTSQVEKPTPLNVALGKKDRLPKPRSLQGSTIAEPEWASSMQKAKEDFGAQHKVQGGLDLLHAEMCTVSRSLLVDDLHRRAQKIYDQRIGRMISNANKKQAWEAYKTATSLVANEM